MAPWGLAQNARLDPFVMQGLPAPSPQRAKRVTPSEV